MIQTNVSYLSYSLDTYTLLVMTESVVDDVVTSLYPACRSVAACPVSTRLIDAFFAESPAHAETLSQKPDHDGRLARRDFNSAFAQLNDEQREALVLVGAGGFSYEEAAETCGVAVGTIKSRVNRARARLAELMDMDDDGVTELTDSVTTAIVSNQKVA